MSRKKIVAGNWKMNTSFSEATDLVEQILAYETNAIVTKILFPPFPFLKTVSDALAVKTGYYSGAQNCSEYEHGAFTGEVSASMISSVGCKFVLIGHSERRNYFKESNAQLVSKIQQAIKNNLVPVFCVGELLAERKSNNQFETVNHQLKEVLRHFTKEEVSNFILAYEPVWAIGTGETATPLQAQEMHSNIRACIKELFKEQIASQIPILYGGSCNEKNAAELFGCEDVDGGLIGGASLKSDSFCKIINSF